MQKCPNCNAPHQDGDESCPYCGRVTPLGVQERERRARLQDEQKVEAERRAALQAVAERTRYENQTRAALRHAYLWSGVGPLLCCLPLGPTVGTVLAWKAHRAVKAHGLPLTALPAQAVSLATLAFTLFIWGLGATAAISESARKAELRTLVEQHSASETLTKEAACALTELKLLEANHQGYDTFNDAFICHGEVVQTGREGRISTYMEEGDKKKNIAVISCLAYDSLTTRWFVSELRSDDQCGSSETSEEDLDASDEGWAPTSATQDPEG